MRRRDCFRRPAFSSLARWRIPQFRGSGNSPISTSPGKYHTANFHGYLDIAEFRLRHSSGCPGALARDSCGALPERLATNTAAPSGEHAASPRKQTTDRGVPREERVRMAVHAKRIAPLAKYSRAAGRTQINTCLRKPPSELGYSCLPGRRQSDPLRKLAGLV
jgi:hypothetical protein